MNYHHDIWLGFLTGFFAKKCMEISILKCPACKDKVKSPLLHLHYQQSLLQKMKAHFNEVQSALISKLDELFDIVRYKLPTSDNPTTDKQIYTNNARIFLHTANANTLYYGRYLSETNDCVIHELLNRKTSKKRKLEAKNSENDVIHIQNSFNKKSRQQSAVQPSTSYMTTDQMNQMLSSQPTNYIPQSTTNNLNPLAYSEFDQLSDIYFNS